MASARNYTLIGGFVAGAIALAVAGIIAFGSGKFFAQELHFVLFFDSSVKGLQVGAPVTFRGVKIGSVKDIVLRLDPGTDAIQMPVYIDVDPRNFLTEGAKYEPYGNYQQLIEKQGMRARLELQSFVTGQLAVGLDFFPDQPARLQGGDHGSVREIPTIPSSMEQLQRTLENLPLKDILEKVNSVMTEIERVLKPSDMDTLMASVRGSLGSFEQLIGEVRAEIPSLSSSVKATSEAARSALQTADRVIAETGTRVNEIAPSVHGATDAAEAALVQAKETLSMRQGVVGQIATSVLDTLAEARKNLASVEKILVEVDAVAAAGADMAVPIQQTLEEIRAMTRSIRTLSDYLERHPEALLRGKASQEGN